MSPATSRSLVLDASVICSSGNTEHPTSKASREALDAILLICHHVVITKDIREEWKRHRSGYSQTWHVAMESKNKVHNLDAVDTVELLNAMAESSMGPSDHKRVEKDAHIINAALSSDKVIVTYDNQLKKTMEKYGPLASISARIIWVNPVKDGPLIFESI